MKEPVKCSIAKQDNLHSKNLLFLLYKEILTAKFLLMNRITFENKYINIKMCSSIPYSRVIISSSTYDFTAINPGPNNNQGLTAKCASMRLSKISK